MTKTEKRLVYWLKPWLCRLGFVICCGAVACTLRGAWAGAMGVGLYLLYVLQHLRWVTPRLRIFSCWEVWMPGKV